MLTAPPDSLQQLLKILRYLPKLEQLPPPLSRSLAALAALVARPRRQPPIDEVVHRTGHGKQIVRELRPAGADPAAPALLYLHGGGWTIGSSAMYRPFCRLLAATAGCTVFAADYRRAPEHPFPAALDDSEAAWSWLVKAHAGRLLAIGGDSAGAQLATVLCRRLRDRGERLPKAQFLIYPVTSMAQDTPSYREFASGYILNRSLIDYFFRHYLRGVAAEARTSPDLAPLAATDLSGLPPAYIAVAGHDILRDQGVAYAARLEAAGVPVTLEIHRDMIHGFVNLLALTAPRRHAERCGQQLRHLLTARMPDGHPAAS